LLAEKLCCPGDDDLESAGHNDAEERFSLVVRHSSIVNFPMTHAQLVNLAINWLRRYRCGVVLSEQACASGEVPDAIGWKGRCRSVVVECKVSRADFLADRAKPFRQNCEIALGCERFYLAPAGLIAPQELPPGWGLLECSGRTIELRVKPARRSLRTAAGMEHEMNLLLASLRRVEIRIEPQTITEFLKWKNRLLEYNGGIYPRELTPLAGERNPHLR
jgi:hypothetical protein